MFHDNWRNLTIKNLFLIQISKFFFDSISISEIILRKYDACAIKHIFFIFFFFLIIRFHLALITNNFDRIRLQGCLRYANKDLFSVFY